MLVTLWKKYPADLAGAISKTDVKNFIQGWRSITPPQAAATRGGLSVGASVRLCFDFLKSRRSRLCSSPAPDYSFKKNLDGLADSFWRNSIKYLKISKAPAMEYGLPCAPALFHAVQRGDGSQVGWKDDVSRWADGCASGAMCWWQANTCRPDDDELGLQFNEFFCTRTTKSYRPGCSHQSCCRSAS